MRAACLFLLLAGCYRPDLTQFTFRCNLENPDCPTGYHCESEVCLPGEPTIDLQEPLPIDMSSPPPDLAPPNGCRNEPGSKVGVAYACPGRIGTNGTPAGLFCATGYRPCIDATGLDLAKCEALGGFFAANVPGHLTTAGMPATGTCGAGGSNNTVWFGCGASRSTIYTYSTGCSGYTQYLDCVSDTTWSCAFATLGQIQTTVATDGILCCPM